jgi:hypothetical protein
MMPAEAPEYPEPDEDDEANGPQMNVMREELERAYSLPASRATKPSGLFRSTPPYAKDLTFDHDPWAYKGPWPTAARPAFPRYEAPVAMDHVGWAAVLPAPPRLPSMSISLTVMIVVLVAAFYATNDPSLTSVMRPNDFVVRSIDDKGDIAFVFDYARQQIGSNPVLP